MSTESWWVDCPQCRRVHTKPECSPTFAEQLAAARAEGAAEALSDCSRCSKPASAVGSPDDLPVCQGCAVQVGMEAVAERVNALTPTLVSGHYWPRESDGVLVVRVDDLRAALGVGEDLPQGERESLVCTCTRADHDRLLIVRPDPACPLNGVTGQERGQDGV